MASARKNHPERDSQDQHFVRYRRHLPGQYLQIRFGNCDNNTHQKPRQQDSQQLLHFGYLHTDTLPDGGHGHLGSKLEEPHADDQHKCPCQKHDDTSQLHRYQKYTEHQDNSGNWKHGRE